MKPNLFFLISAPRSTPKIPRKFVRTFNGTPLIQYSVTLARQLAPVENVFVLTDDEEIELHARRAGASTRLYRSDHGEACPFMFGDGDSLSILSAAELEARSQFDACIWLGAASPLLRKRDLRDAYNLLLTTGKDAIYSASETPQMGWLCNKTHHPRFVEHPNAVQGAQHQETGAFFIMRRSSIAPSGYSGNSAAPFFLHQSHSVEILTYQDWWVAEHLAKRKQILFVVTGYPEVGMGHVYRVLLLAQEFHHHEVQFLCTLPSKMAYDVIVQHEYDVALQHKDKTLVEEIKARSPDVIINDILDTSAEYITALKSLGIHVINFEDEGSGAAHADAVVNALYEKPITPNMYVGPDYFCLRSEFLTAPMATRNDEQPVLLVTFGGVDPNNLTERTTLLVENLAKRVRFSLVVITGPGYGHKNSFAQTVEKIHNRGNLQLTWIGNGTKRISDYMAQADLAITSAGRTVYELTALEVPAIVVAANEREQMHAFARQAGMIYLGLHSEVANRELEENLLVLLLNPTLRNDIRKRLRSFDLKNGKKRVLDLIWSFMLRSSNC